MAIKIDTYSPYDFEVIHTEPNHIYVLDESKYAPAIGEPAVEALISFDFPVRATFAPGMTPGLRIGHFMPARSFFTLKGYSSIKNVKMYAFGYGYTIQVTYLR